jgi:hypothetical protein
MNAVETEQFLKRHPELDDGIEVDDFHEIERQDFAREKTALEKAQAKRRAMADAGIKVKVLNPLERLATNPKSLRYAITACCWQCIGEGIDPNPREAIRSCQIPGCALFQVRPYQRKASGIDSEC